MTTKPFSNPVLNAMICPHRCCSFLRYTNRAPRMVVRVRPITLPEILAMIGIPSQLIADAIESLPTPPVPPAFDYTSDDLAPNRTLN